MTGTGIALPSIGLANEQTSQANGDLPELIQIAEGNELTFRGTLLGPVTKTLRAQGRTTNRLYAYQAGAVHQLEPEQTITDETTDNPLVLIDKIRGFGFPTDNPSSDLSYLFQNDDGGLGFFLDNTQSLYDGTWSDIGSPLLFRDVNAPLEGSVYTDTQFTKDMINFDEFEGGGGPFPAATEYNLLTAGLIDNNAEGFRVDLIRQADNFVFLQAQPAKLVVHELTERYNITDNIIDDPIAFYHDLNTFGLNGNIADELLTNTVIITTIADPIIQRFQASSINEWVPNTDANFASYKAVVDTIIADLQSSAATNQTITDDVIAAVNTLLIDNPEGLLDISQLQNLSTTDGIANDPMAFLVASGLDRAQNYTLSDINAFAQAILTITDRPLVFDDLANNSRTITSDEIKDILGALNAIVPRDQYEPTADHFFFATGDLDGRLPESHTTQFSVDHFELGSGIVSCTNANGVCDLTLSGPTALDGIGIRAFGRVDTELGLPLLDTGLLVVNPANEQGDAQTALLQVDFGYAGNGATQNSTISATIGDLRYEEVIFERPTCNNCEEAELIERSIELSAEAQTIGTSQGIIGSDSDNESTTAGQRGTVGFTSPLRLTASGGANPSLQRQGYAGYLLLQNYDPTPQFEDEAPITGGQEVSIGQSLGDNLTDPDTTVNYGLLRLGVATGETAVGERTSTESALTGWAAGLSQVEVQTGDNTSVALTPIDTDDSPNNFTLATDAETNRVAATIQLHNRDNPLILGGLTGDDTKGASAFVDNERYAARTLDSDSNANAALVSGDLVKAGLPIEEQAKIPDYEHLQWGFFFGDLALTDTTREHLHLGSWVAGDASDPANFPSTGTATYHGHVVGNVHNNGDNYNAIGSISNTWNFGLREGSVEMSFDEANYTGQTRLQPNSVVFDGALDSAERIGSVQGNFIQSNTDPAAAIGGRFAIQNREGGTVYRASGTFAGEK